ncbi:MAG: heme o synthase [Geminicoccaceae bacterium]
MARALSKSRLDTLPGRTAGQSELVDYWRLLKPNVMQLVVFTGGVGLFIAPGSLHPLLAFVAILCIAVGAGASAAINNAYDIDIDRVMVRTRLRPTASGRISPADALATGITLAIGAVTVMGLAVNWLAGTLLALTIAFYVLVYTLWLKRRTPQNIVIGGAAGAFPPMIGWAAVTGRIELMPILLFLIVFFWTPPHFWALALYRRKDYADVGVPMLPVVAGPDATRRHIFGYSLLLAVISLLPTLVGTSGWLYLAAAAALSGMLVQGAWRVLRTASDREAMRLFKFSIVYLFGLFLALVLDHAVQLWLLP